jgi:hypothetical protein
MVTDDEMLALEYEQAHKRFFDLIFLSTTIVVGVAAMPLGFLIPFGPMEARTGFCFLILVATLLLFRFFREVYSRWSEMDKARRKITFRIASRSQQTTIVAEPVYTH